MKKKIIIPLYLKFFNIFEGKLINNRKYFYMIFITYLENAYLSNDKYKLLNLYTLFR